jgi:hypothetical protein
MRARSLLNPLLILSTLLISVPALADRGFAPIPAAETGGKPPGLELRIVRYDGSTNGELSVEVRNPGTEPAAFEAHGLYFVPRGNANEAPQRLGAVGPFKVKTAGGWQRREATTLAPGETARLHLDVYCIDSHRSSPDSSTPFRMARGRVPKPIVQAIAQDAQKAAAGLGGVSSPRAKGAVQSQVWKNRDQKWIELDGEGAQEAGKRR